LASEQLALRLASGFRTNRVAQNQKELLFGPIRRSAVVKLKVRKFGNSLGVVLPKEVINRLHTGDGEPLFLIEAPEGGYRLTPYDPGFEEKMAKADEIIGRYRNTLHVLAK
jgi:putative addiction module antidote